MAAQRETSNADLASIKSTAVACLQTAFNDPKLNFPLATTNAELATLTPDDIAKGVGYILRNYANANTFIQLDIESALDKPDETRLLIRPTTTSVTRPEFYKDWTKNRAVIVENVYSLLKLHLDTLTATPSTVSDADLRQEAQNIAEIDRMLASYHTKPKPDDIVVTSVQAIDVNADYNGAISFTRLVAILGDAKIGQDPSRSRKQFEC